MRNENCIESYTNLLVKDSVKNQTKGFRCIIEHESLNYWQEPIKSFCVFPPQTLESPKTQEEFNWMLERRVTDMKVLGYKNIIIHNKTSSIWKQYTTSLK